MTQAYQINKPLLIKFILIGGGIAFLLALLFIRTAEAGNAVWPKYWAIRPVIILPLSGGVGGAFTNYLMYLTTQGGWRRALAIVLSLIIYLVGIWMGFVLGFDGTLWH